MARRRLIWQIGLSHAPRPVVGTSLDAHAAALADDSVLVAATTQEAELATRELLRTHRAAGLSRKDVEGRWSRICDRIWAHKGLSVLATPDLCVADKDQIRLALDPLIGVEVHLVVTVDPVVSQLYGGWQAELAAGEGVGWDSYTRRVLDGVRPDRRDHRQAEVFWAGHDLEAVLSRWGWTFHADRLHVLASPDPAALWTGFLDLAGLSSRTAQLPAVVPPYAEPGGPSVLPRVSTAGLAPRATHWTEALGRAGHDLRGDLEALLSADEGPGDGSADQLRLAVDALADALAQNAVLRRSVAALEADRDRLDRKRRKLKRRLRAATAVGEN